MENVRVDKYYFLVLVHIYCDLLEMAYCAIECKWHIHIHISLDVRSKQYICIIIIIIMISEHLIFPLSSLTFPVVSFLFLGVFVFLSFFIRSAGGAKYSGGKGICPTHTQAPYCQMTTHTHMHTGNLQDRHTKKKHTQKNEQCKDSEAIISIKQKKHRKRKNRLMNKMAKQSNHINNVKSKQRLCLLMRRWQLQQGYCCWPH